ncbi:arginine repressor [Geothrix rubra]|uniref:Arginine repressor n=2 Tax=Geothrix rubra TaxID=2927977 RepID=A0ABQ5Q7L6_9BACT|nr:arginine repressor [Geothrix rubra]
MHRICMHVDELILRLLEAHPIADQTDLLARLSVEGHALTQSTLSRRLKRLGVQKVQGRYRRVEAAAQAMPEAEVSAVPPNLLVVRTAPGFAQALGLALDRDPVAGQMGTLAGDDTVFVAVLPERMEDVRAHLARVLAAR